MQPNGAAAATRFDRVVVAMRSRALSEAIAVVTHQAMGQDDGQRTNCTALTLEGLVGWEPTDAGDAPDLVLLDGDREEHLAPAVDAIAGSAPHAVLALLVSRVRPGHADLAERLGIDVLVARDHAPETLLELISEGRSDATGPTGLSDGPLAGLTTRQREVLAELASGADSAEIAERLGITEPTVRTHVQHVLDRLGVASRHEAVSVALQSDLPRTRVRS